MRLAEDLERAGIHAKWWVVNSSLYFTKTNSPLLKIKSQSKIEWVNKVLETSAGHTVLLKWHGQELQENHLLNLITAAD